MYVIVGRFLGSIVLWVLLVNWFWARVTRNFFSFGVVVLSFFRKVLRVYRYRLVLFFIVLEFVERFSFSRLYRVESKVKLRTWFFVTRKTWYG